MSNKNNNPARRPLRWVMFTLLFLAVLVACGFSAWMFMEVRKLKDPQQSRQQQTNPASEKNAEPLYQSLNTFTLSLKPVADEENRVLFVGLSLRLGSKESLATFNKFMPEYRSRLLLLLAEYSYDDLASREGKQRMLDKIRQELSKPLSSGQSVTITDVLINEFILR